MSASLSAFPLCHSGQAVLPTTICNCSGKLYPIFIAWFQYLMSRVIEQVLCYGSSSRSLARLDLDDCQCMPTKSSYLRLITSLLTAVLLVLCSSLAHAGGGKTLRMATGNVDGVYYPIGQGIAAATSGNDFKIEVMSSQGSVQNLEWLSKGKAELGLTQSDTAYYAYNGLGRFKEKITNVQPIASLYTEAVHILVRTPLFLSKIEDFKGKRISVGPLGSGTESNAIAVLEAAGITTNDAQILHLNLSDSINALKEGSVDVLFFTAGYPASAVKTIMQNKIATLFELNPEINARILDNSPFFVITNKYCCGNIGSTKC